jgi:hypothetical protein
MWGEAALYAVHIYNLTPHTALIERKALSAVPRKLYLGESDERMSRLYTQLVPFGICCHIIQTGDKPKQVKKLDQRSVPGIIVGYGPSTKQYRVLALHSTMPYKVFIVRHVIINSAHFNEYFSRTSVVPEIRRFASVHFVDVLNGERVSHVSVPASAAAVPMVVVCAMALPAHALSRGSECTDDVEVEAEEEAPIAVDEDDSVVPEERERSRERWDVMDKSIRDIEPNHELVGLEDLTKMQLARTRWLKVVNDIKVSFREGNVQIHMSNVSDHDDNSCAEQPGQVIVDLWHAQDVKLWTIDLDNPTFRVAMNGPDREKWMEAFTSELNALRELDTFELVPRPVDQTVIKGKPVCKIKRAADGSIERYKVRYVGCGYDQTEGVDYFEHHVWAPTGQHATLRVLIVHAATFGCMMRHIDISTAFLHGELNETVYVEQPPILNDGTDHVWRLKKSLYGLKQAGRQWHLKLSEALKQMDFKRAGYDPALFVRCDSGEKQFIFLWVDDLIIVAEQASCDAIVERILASFKGRDLGEASWLLGMSVKRNMNDKIVELSQERMIENVLARFGQENARFSWLPLDATDGPTPDPHEKARTRKRRELAQTDNRDEMDKLNIQLAKYDADAMPLTKEEHSKYMSIVGTVQYIAVVTRPDIAFAAATLARFMSCPTRHLMNCAIRLLRYLSATRTLVLQYKCAGNDNPILHGYSDADFAGCSTTSKSTSGIAIMFRGQPVYWRSKRQPIVTSSTTEAELVALNLCALQVQWLKLLLGDDLGVGPLRAKLYCDNQSTVTVAHNPIASDRSRHINVKHRKVQELIEHQVLSVEWISTTDQVADILTKQMTRKQFE